VCCVWTAITRSSLGLLSPSSSRRCSKYASAHQHVPVTWRDFAVPATRRRVSRNSRPSWRKQLGRESLAFPIVAFNRFPAFQPRARSYQPCDPVFPYDSVVTSFARFINRGRRRPEPFWLSSFVIGARVRCAICQSVVTRSLYSVHPPKTDSKPIIIII